MTRRDRRGTETNDPSPRTGSGGKSDRASGTETVSIIDRDTVENNNLRRPVPVK